MVAKLTDVGKTPTYNPVHLPVATQAPSPALSICPEKRKLGDLFLDAVREVMELHNQVLAAVAAGADGERLNLALGRARKKRDAAKNRYIIHFRTHGC